jgi:hypothetical protein
VKKVHANMVQFRKDEEMLAVSKKEMYLKKMGVLVRNVTITSIIKLKYALLMKHYMNRSVAPSST